MAYMFLKDKACVLLNEFFQEYSENKIKIIRNGLGISEENFVAIDRIIKKQNPRLPLEA